MERMKPADAEREWGAHRYSDTCPWEKPNLVTPDRRIFDNYYRNHLRQFALGSTPPIAVLGNGDKFDIENYPVGTVFWNTGITIDQFDKVRHWSEYAILAQVTDSSNMNGALRTTLVSFDAASFGAGNYDLRSTYFNPRVIGRGEHKKLITSRFFKKHHIKNCTRMEILKFGNG